MLKENLDKIFEKIKNGNNLGEQITLVGATKTVPIERINKAVEYGLKVVAENKVQEFREKTDYIIGAEQHFIGHLQSNKAKYLVGKVALIHSVDSLSLAKIIDDIAEKRNVKQNVLLEVNIGKEENKSGFFAEEVLSSAREIVKFKNVSLQGLMAMLPKNAEEEKKVKLCLQMRDLFDTLKEEGLPFKYLSLGMSEDYLTAIKCGSNMIRLGSEIFGKRNYGDKNGLV